MRISAAEPRAAANAAEAGRRGVAEDASGSILIAVHALVACLLAGLAGLSCRSFLGRRSSSSVPRPLWRPTSPRSVPAPARPRLTVLAYLLEYGVPRSRNSAAARGRRGVLVSGGRLFFGPPGLIGRRLER
jgi:hypothetical protein